MLTDIGLAILPRLHAVAEWATDYALAFELYVARWRKLLGA